MRSLAEAEEAAGDPERRLMATLTQHGEHYFGGTRANDYLVGDAAPKIIIGGDGDDVITPVSSQHLIRPDRISIYGMACSTGSGTVPVCYDRPGSIAHRAAAGNDFIAIGRTSSGRRRWP